MTTPSALAEPLDTDRTYSTNDVCRLAGLSYRTVDYWCRRGVIVPEVDAHGSGSSRVFTAGQVAEFRAAAALRRLGAPLDVIAELVGMARQHPGGVTLVWDGTAPQIARYDEEAIEAVRRSGGAAVVVTLDGTPT